jgi:Protein of unknown function (DUF1402)
MPTARLAFAIFALLAALTQSRAATLVPEGNRNETQPAVPSGSAKRTAATKSSFDAKYQKVFRLLQNDPKLRGKIRKVSARYGIDPLHMVGAIVGEHTYNVDAYDRLQTYYVKAVSYVSEDISFSYEGQSIADFVQRPEFEECAAAKGSYALWNCRENVWNSVFRGHTVDGVAYPRNRFSAVFFQPFYAGQTFGLGQLNPLTALQMTDMVHRISGLPKIDASDGKEVYRTIMDPDLTLPYMAATLKQSIDAYARIAGFDISGNPGLTATLYNTGDPEARAQALAADNEARRAAGEPERVPEENYYGWLVNEKLGELKTLF